MCLNSAQKKEFDVWVQEHKIICPVCGGGQLRHAEPVCIPRYGIDLGGCPGGGADEPILRLFCPTCAYVLHFRARQVLNLPEKGAEWV